MRRSTKVRRRACCAGIATVVVSALPATGFGQEVADHRPVISPDGTRVVFMRRSEATRDDWELYLVDPTEGDATRLTHSEGWDGYAVFSPDASRVVFDRGQVGRDDEKSPHLLDLESKAVTPLGEYDGWVSVSDWSADHGLLAFWEHDGQRDLYLLDEEGAVRRRLTATPRQSEHDAHFSPDGVTIVFASGPSDGNGVTALELMDIAGGDRRSIVESPGRIYGPAWSPDGDRIAFTDAPDGENGDLYLIDIRTEEIRRLTTHPAWDHMPVWSRNGERLLFTSYRSGAERMYWLDIDSGTTQAWRVR